MFKPRGTVDAIVNLVDIPQTLLSFAGVEIPMGMRGHNLGPVLQGSADRVCDATIIECQATQNIYQQTMVTDQYKLVVYRDSDYGELYDLREGPNQYINLWNKPEHQAIKTELLLQFAQTRMKMEGKLEKRKAFA